MEFEIKSLGNLLNSIQSKFPNPPRLPAAYNQVVIFQAEHFINPRTYRSGDFMIMSGSYRAMENFESEINRVADFFKGIVISSLFVQDNPHILFFKQDMGGQILQILSAEDALEIAASEQARNLDESAQKEIKKNLFVALIRNFELYQLVENPYGLIMRWGKSLDEEERPREVDEDRRMYVEVLAPHLKNLADEGKFVTWWTRKDVQNTPHFAGGNVLRTTSLDKIRAEQSHFIGKDEHQATALVLVKK